MKTPTLIPDELLALGFKYLGKFGLERGDYYTWYQLNKNENEIDVTCEYNGGNHEVIIQYVDFNCEKLKGRELTLADIKFLIEIM